MPWNFWKITYCKPLPARASEGPARDSTHPCLCRRRGGSFGSLLLRAAVGCPAPTRLSADLRHLGQHLFHGRSLHSLLLHHLLHQVMSDASVDGPLLETSALPLKYSWDTPAPDTCSWTSFHTRPLPYPQSPCCPRQGRQRRWTGRDCRDRQSSGCAAASGQNQSLDFFLLSPRTKDNYAPEVKDKMEILG